MGTGRLVRVWVRVRVRVRYRYSTGTVRVRYMGTVGTVHGYGFRTMYPNSGRNSGRSAAISAAIWVHGTDFCRYLGTWYGYGRYGTWVRCMGTIFVPMYRMYRTDRTHVSYPYRTCTVPAPVHAPKPVPTVPYLSFGIPSCFQNGQ